MAAACAPVIKPSLHITTPGGRVTRKISASAQPAPSAGLNIRMDSPSSLKSVYRLVLRACSTAVLHHRGATRNLRNLYRPIFRSAGAVIQEIQSCEPRSPRRQKLEAWFTEWNKQIDNTLSFLYNSSVSRGLPHQITRNLGLLVLGQQQRLNSQRILPWKPNAPQPEPMKAGKVAQHARWEAMEENAWAALSHTIKMAEARQGLTFGKVAVRGKIFPRRADT
ncbi:hypothetical protein PC9H_008123 [Pleurotus ostreatus]|uniref:Uncharacterized protein n=1 Tax=Pleurotus ostreatus TaxID=5322 RepID=A0A8H6ZV82_PLEOS|nr:uncharacterized protein PC9H_008123 [Pleurotus ostreatus]KAF7428891.1 hypothetical protein PC9H_008123 [Pleurotus ostreatus]